MGCDIHCIAERKESWGWERVYPAPTEREPYYVSAAAEQETNGNYWSWAHAHAILGWYHARNYNIFGILAGVRGPEAPITEPRGYPTDLSGEGKHWARRYELQGEVGECIDIAPGEHSFSWLTVAELQEHEARLREADPDFTDRVVAALLKRGKADQVRLVFGFDS